MKIAFSDLRDLEILQEFTRARKSQLTVTIGLGGMVLEIDLLLLVHKPF